MMIYLASNLWPEIQFVVNQWAQFTHNYRSSHEYAVIVIYRYLKDTHKKGLILSHTRKIHVNCYVYSNFVGLFYY